MPLCPPFSTIAWAYCVKDCCHCTDDGRKLRFWIREWYRLPGDTRFHPVKIGAQQAPLWKGMDMTNWVREQNEPTAVIELQPRQCGRHVEYQMFREDYERHQSLTHCRGNEFATCIVRAEQDSGSMSPPSYEAAIGQEATNRSRVVVEYYRYYHGDAKPAKR